MSARPRVSRSIVIGFAALAAAASVAAVALSAGGAGATAGGRVTTNGTPLTLRSAATSNAGAVAALPDGTHIAISCQTTGQTITGHYGRSNIWDRTTYRGHTGYVSDTYVYTGSDSRVAPNCGGSKPPSTAGCSTSGTGDPHSCAQAVAWARAHIHSGYVSSYFRTCDHLVGLAYGFPASGSATAYTHWTQIPSKYRHSGSRSVPAGGLAFFSTSSAGHVMISIGGGKFVSNDIHGNGSYTVTTIAEIQSRWGSHYLGWAQPWFKYNH